MAHGHDCVSLSVPGPFEQSHRSTTTPILNPCMSRIPLPTSGLQHYSQSPVSQRTAQSPDSPAPSSIEQPRNMSSVNMSPAANSPAAADPRRKQSKRDEVSAFHAPPMSTPIVYGTPSLIAKYRGHRTSCLHCGLFRPIPFLLSIPLPVPLPFSPSPSCPTFSSLIHICSSLRPLLFLQSLPLYILP